MGNTVCASKIQVREFCPSFSRGSSSDFFVRTQLALTPKAMAAPVLDLRSQRGLPRCTEGSCNFFAPTVAEAHSRCHCQSYVQDVNPAFISRKLASSYLRLNGRPRDYALGSIL